MEANLTNKIKLSVTLNNQQKKLFKYLFLEAKKIYLENKDVKEFSLEIRKAFKDLSIKYNTIEIFDFEKNLDKLLDNKIIYNISFTDSDEVIKGKFNLMSSYNIRQEILNYTFPLDILESMGNENYFSTLDFLVSIELELERSLILYRELTRNIDNKQKKFKVEIEIDRYKELMQTVDIYKRIYDLERKVINPTVQDINNYSQYHIIVDKIKENLNEKSKVKFLVFVVYLKEDFNKIHHLLELFPLEYRNDSKLKEKVEEYYYKEGYDFVYKAVNYSKENLNSLTLKDRFLKTLTEIYIENKDAGEDYILYEEIRSGIEKFSKFKNKMGRVLLQTRFELPVLLDILNGVSMEKLLKYENKYYRIRAYYSEDREKRYIMVYKRIGEEKFQKN